MFTNRWYLDPGTPLYVICEGFRNPRTTRKTDTFKIHVRDELGYYIEDRMDEIYTQMLVMPEIPFFTVIMENFTNGDVNTYTMSTKSPLPHFDGDIFQFRFPYQILLKEQTVCTPISPLKTIDCKNIDGHLIEATMTFDGEFLEKNTEITFLFLEV